MKFAPFFFVLIVLVLIFIGIICLYRSRTIAMRDLATRWNLQYSDGDPRIWSAGRLATVQHPTGFKMSCYPASEIGRMWNVIDGQRNGKRVLIFDSTVGNGKGIDCSFVTAQTSEMLLKGDSSGEKIAQCSGWIAVYRMRFIQVPWTLSVKRIEQLLNSL